MRYTYFSPKSVILRSHPSLSGRFY